MSNSKEYLLNSPIIHGVKIEPLETDVSTDDYRENYSFFPVKSRIPSPSDSHLNQLDESKVLVNSTLTQCVPDRWTCSICCMGFFKKRLLLNHRTEVHKHDPKKCLECGKTVQRNKTLRKHMRNFHPSKLITCDVCSDGFFTNKALKKHYKKVHEGTGTRSWYVPAFENSASSSVESKDSIMKIEETVESKDNLCLPIIKSEPL